MLLLNSPEKYHYLKQSGCYGDPSINDKEDFNNVMVCQLKKNCVCITHYLHVIIVWQVDQLEMLQCMNCLQVCNYMYQLVSV